MVKPKHVKNKCDPERLANYRFGLGGCCRGRSGCTSLQDLKHDEILVFRRYLSGCSRGQRQVWLRSEAMKAKDRNTGHLQHFHVGNLKLCIVAFCELYNITRQTLYNHSNMEQPSIRKPTTRDCPKSGAAKAWLQISIPEIADQSPTSNKYVMPDSTLTKKDLLRVYLYDQKLPEGYISKTTWYRLLKVGNSQLELVSFFSGSSSCLFSNTLTDIVFVSEYWLVFYIYVKKVIFSPHPHFRKQRRSWILK